MAIRTEGPLSARAARDDLPRPLATRSCRRRLDTRPRSVGVDRPMLAWEEKHIALAEAALEDLAPGRAEVKVTNLLPQP